MLSHDKETAVQLASGCSARASDRFSRRFMGIVSGICGHGNRYYYPLYVYSGAFARSLSLLCMR